MNSSHCGVAQVAADWTAPVRMTSRVRHRYPFLGQRSDQRGEVAIFLKVHGIALHVGVRRDLISNAQIVENLLLYCSPTVPGVCVKFDYK